MDVRPILLCATEEDGTTPTMGEPLASALSRQGYIVVHCPPSKMLNFRVLAPCPFTHADVDSLRALAPQMDHLATPEGVEWMFPKEALLSIADRIEGLL